MIDTCTSEYINAKHRSSKATLISLTGLSHQTSDKRPRKSTIIPPTLYIMQSFSSTFFSVQHRKRTYKQSFLHAQNYKSADAHVLEYWYKYPIITDQTSKQPIST